MSAPDPDPASLIATFTTMLAAPVAVAVSGGGDSLALLLLLAEAGAASAVYTVDHSLRPQSAAEAQMVAAVAARLGLPHRTLHWRWDGQGNLAESARIGRYQLLAAACRADGIAGCALAHTRGDNVESLMLGLLRGAGIDGLCGMRPRFAVDNVTFYRPLLAASRGSLRAVLQARSQPWIDDPTNEDATHERARLRQAMRALGLPEARLARTVAQLAATRVDLGHELLRAMDGHWRADGPDLLFDLTAYCRLSGEFRRRLLSAALQVVACAQHPPRAAKLTRAVRRDWTEAPAALTLHGCILRATGGALRLSREPAAVAPARVMGADQADCIWDRRWRLTGPGGVEVRALGADGFARIGAGSPLPRRSLLAAPSVWRAGAPVFSPFTRDQGSEAQAWRCDELSPGFAALVSGR